MPLELGNGFCTPSEPSARVGHKGNDPRRLIAVNIDLQQIQRCRLAWQIALANIPLTVKLASMNVLLLASKWWAPAKKLAPLMLSYRRWTFRMREGRKDRTTPKPHSRHEAKACLCLFLQKLKHVHGLFWLQFSSLLEVLSRETLPNITN